MKRLLLAALLVLPLPATAKDGKDPFAACRADFERLCKDVKPGEGRQMKCMMENKSRASGGCQALLAEKEAKEKRGQHQKP